MHRPHELDSKGVNVAYPKKWDEEAILASASKYENKALWRKAEPKTYQAAYRMKIIAKADKVFSHPTAWTKERVLADARQYEKLTIWRKESQAAYQYAYRMGLVKECVRAMKHPEAGNKAWKWTEENLIADAKKYESKYDWRRHSYSAFMAAYRKGLMSKCCMHMSGNPTKYDIKPTPENS